MQQLTTPTDTHCQVRYKGLKTKLGKAQWVEKGTRLMSSTLPSWSLSPACPAFTPQHELTCADRHKYAGLLQGIKNSILPASLKHTSLPVDILWGCWTYFFLCVCVLLCVAVHHAWQAILPRKQSRSHPIMVNPMWKLNQACIHW